MSLFTNKTLLITGGTGSFGNAVLNRFLKTDIGEIRIFSRDEKKQDDMRHEFQAKMPEVAEKIKFYIGDVRDIQSVKNAMHGVDYIFHAAALKQVPSCEFFPIEAVKTNVLGTENVLTAAIEAGVKNIVCLSTDKAAYPVNAMGTSKAMMEKVIVAKSRTVSPEKTKICCTRYGNVMCSRGSVIPLWIDQIRAGKPITITDPTMTRFIMSLDEAVDLVLFAFEHGESGDILVQKAPACTIQTQAEAVSELFGGDKNNIKVIGIRHGEKMYETLLTNEECAKAYDLGNFYRVPCDKRGLNYDKYFKEGDVKRSTLTEFNSNNTTRLNLEQTKAKIASLQYIQEELKNKEIRFKDICEKERNYYYESYCCHAAAGRRYGCIPADLRADTVILYASGSGSCLWPYVQIQTPAGSHQIIYCHPAWYTPDAAALSCILWPLLYVWSVSAQKLPFYCGDHRLLH